MKKQSRAVRAPREVFSPEGIPMRRLVHSWLTNGFLAKGRTWTHDLASARSFASYADAFEWKEKESLAEVEVYYSFGGNVKSPHDFVMHLP